MIGEGYSVMLYPFLLFTLKLLTMKNTTPKKERTLDEIKAWWDAQKDGKLNFTHYLKVVQAKANVINLQLN